MLHEVKGLLSRIKNFFFEGCSRLHDTSEGGCKGIVIHSLVHDENICLLRLHVDGHHDIKWLSDPRELYPRFARIVDMRSGP